jgi:hypothetical protein
MANPFARRGPGRDDPAELVGAVLGDGEAAAMRELAGAGPGAEPGGTPETEGGLELSGEESAAVERGERDLRAAYLEWAESLGFDAEWVDGTFEFGPDGAHCPGYLYLRGTPVSSLPEGLAVGGDLYLGGTPVSSLPEGLAVGGDLELEDTPVSSLPEGLAVGGKIRLNPDQRALEAEAESRGFGVYIID